MRFLPRSELFLSFVIFHLLFCGLCTSRGIAQDRKPDQQTTGTDSSGQQDNNRPASALTRQPGAAQSRPFGNVESTVEVRTDDLANQISPVRVGIRQDIQSSAGTFGDFSRYLQLMPGVAANADAFNDLLVRGGHPSENLYVVDGLEVPNINHFAFAGTTTGFTPMINTSTISRVELQPGVYDAKYSSRLSSLVEIHTRDQHETVRSGEVDLGIAGLGAFWESPAERPCERAICGRPKPFEPGDQQHRAEWRSDLHQWDGAPGVVSDQVRHGFVPEPDWRRFDCYTALRGGPGGGRSTSTHSMTDCSRRMAWSGSIRMDRLPFPKSRWIFPCRSGISASKHSRSMASICPE